MSRSASLLLSLAAGCLTCGANLVAHADTTSPIPSYFFKEWKVSKSCLEAHAGADGHVAIGQKFRMTAAVANADGTTYKLKSLDSQNRLLAGNWGGVNLQYRPGAKMATVPADFECIPGEEASSPFLALGNYVSNAEPYFEAEHWYALVKIHGEPHHLLIFPRDVTGEDSAIIVLQDAGAADGVTLDNNGVVHTNN
jgi:hypothetical protein